MSPTPATRHLSPLVKAPGRQTTETAWSRLVTELTKHDFVTIAIFCAVGILVTANLVLRFPDLGAALIEFSQPPF